MTAGVIICKTGKTHVSDLKGIGRSMPLTMALFSLVSLGLIGIPPTGGFISKWYIASGAMDLPSVFAFIGPVILLISAILTAAYLLTITIQGFFPGKDFDTSELTPVTSTVLMWGPMLLLTLLVVIGGMFPDRLISYFSVIASSLI
jgi:multicomponent Na+:H+ antiporter subunit D